MRSFYVHIASANILWHAEKILDFVYPSLVILAMLFLPDVAVRMSKKDPARISDISMVRSSRPSIKWPMECVWANLIRWQKSTKRHPKALHHEIQPLHTSFRDVLGEQLAEYWITWPELVSCLDLRWHLRHPCLLTNPVLSHRRQSLLLLHAPQLSAHLILWGLLFTQNWLCLIILSSLEI